jgi:hypothetical protein
MLRTAAARLACSHRNADQCAFEAWSTYRIDDACASGTQAAGRKSVVARIPTSPGSQEKLRGAEEYPDVLTDPNDLRS